VIAHAIRAVALIERTVACATSRCILAAGRRAWLKRNANILSFDLAREAPTRFEHHSEIAITRALDRKTRDHILGVKSGQIQPSYVIKFKRGDNMLRQHEAAVAIDLVCDLEEMHFNLARRTIPIERNPEDFGIVE